jgi:hypothetical protein
MARLFNLLIKCIFAIMKILSISKLLTLAVGISLIASSCSKTEQSRVRVESLSTIEIPATASATDLVDISFSSSLSTKTLLQEEGFDVDNISKAWMEAVEFKMVSPAAESFRFTKGMTLYMSAQGLPEIMVAWKDHPNALTMAPLYLIRGGIDLKAYLAEETINFRLECQMRRLFTEPISFTMRPIFFVEAEKEK